MPAQSSTPSAMTQDNARPRRSAKKAYLMAFGLAFVLELILALSVSSTGKDMLRYLGLHPTSTISAAE